MYSFELKLLIKSLTTSPVVTTTESTSTSTTTSASSPATSTSGGRLSRRWYSEASHTSLTWWEISLTETEVTIKSRSSKIGGIDLGYNIKYYLQNCGSLQEGWSTISFRVLKLQEEVQMTNKDPY